MLAHINTYSSHEFIWSVHILLRFLVLFYRPVLFQEYCCQIMTNPLVLVIPCSDAQQSQSAIVAVSDFLRGKIPKGQQNNSNPGILFISLFLGIWRRLSPFCSLCMSEVILSRDWRHRRIPLFKMLLCSTGDVFVIISPEWLTRRTSH